MKTKYLSLIFILLLAITMGCKKFVEVGPPKTETVIAEAFKRDASATSAVLGIYINMLGDFQFINSGVTISAGLSAGEIESLSTESDKLQFQQNKLLPTNPILNTMWTAAYTNVVLINTCIEGLEQSSTLTPSLKRQLLGECRFNRAFINFYLVNLWGNVPLVTSTNYRENSVIKQSSAADVYKAIVADLKQAQADLLETYPTEGKVRPNKLTATALLSRVYLYTGDYVNAATQATEVIGSGSYSPLVPNSETFLKDSKETIWQLMPSPNLVSATQEGYEFIGDIPYGLAPNYRITDATLNSFETIDNRRSNWINSVNYEGTVYNYPYKYKDRGQYAVEPMEYYVMFRLSEQYLIRAEARAQLNQLTPAAEDLDVIRLKAGLNSIHLSLPLIDKVGLLAAINTENRHEFFAEWGHRWFDLKRTGVQNTSAALFPIPQEQLNLDRNLVQNLDY